MRERLLRSGLEIGLALVICTGIFSLWPRLELERLGREEVWFSLGWLILLGAPSLLRLAIKANPPPDPTRTFHSEACGILTFFMAGCFLVFLISGRSLGNYKLWLGLAYLGGVTLRMVGLSLNLRAAMINAPERIIGTALFAAGLTFTACLLLTPWVRPDLAAAWPPRAEAWLRPFLAAVLWAGLSGALLLGAGLWGLGQRVRWLLYLGVGLGPGAVLAVTWLSLDLLSWTFALAAGLVAFGWILRSKLPRGGPQRLGAVVMHSLGTGAVGFAAAAAVVGLSLQTWHLGSREMYQILASASLWGGASFVIAAGLESMFQSRFWRWTALFLAACGSLFLPALTKQGLAPFGYALLAVAGLTGFSLRIRWLKEGSAEKGEGTPSPLKLYWLLRALMLFWLVAGVMVALAAAWWQPELGTLFRQNIWFRALALGAFLVACLGLLAEYSLPLLGRPEGSLLMAERKPLGLILSSLALVAAFVPVLATSPYQQPTPPPYADIPPRAEVLPAPVLLGPENREITLSLPSWVKGLSRIYVVSLLANGAGVVQGEAVAQITATSDMDLISIYQLRAGIDTAEWAINKRDVALTVRHQAARPAQTWWVYTPAGESFRAQTYYTGLFLGKTVETLKTIRLRYRYPDNPPGVNPVLLEIKRILIY